MHKNKDFGIHPLRIVKFYKNLEDPQCLVLQVGSSHPACC